MKIQLLSDLHREMAPYFSIPDTDADVIILAGDIDGGNKGIEWAISEALRLQKPLLYIAGNHEYYRHEYFSLQAQMREIAENCSLIHFLECDETIIGDVRFLGTTLWTDYACTRLSEQSENMRLMASILRDHQVISMTDRLFTPADALSLHQASKAWLENTLNTPYESNTIVITHHGPSIKCAHRDFGNSQMASGFISNLDYLVKKADAWCYGHTHSSLDRKLGNCRLISNQKGYPRELVPGGFQADIIFEV